MNRPNRNRTVSSALVSAGFVGATFLLAAPALAGNGVTVESVNDYTLVCGAGVCDLPNSIANGSGFVSTITTTGAFTRDLAYTNSSVFDTDFVDPERAGGVNDSDTWNFDRSSDAIAYFTGHGGSEQATSGTCNTSADCTSPPPGASGHGFCRASPPNYKYCMYASPRSLLTSSSYDKRGHYIYYGDGKTALGEGYWGNIFGAGTNGGVNLAVLDVSHGVTAMFWNEELTPAFAGLHLLATIMPINGDTANMPNRGSTYASQYLVNPNGSVAMAWLETLNSLPQYGPWACGSATWNDYTYGGGHGINGCGCNFIMSVDSSSYWSNWHINNETWNLLSYDGNDADGASWFTARRGRRRRERYRLRSRE